MIAHVLRARRRTRDPKNAGRQRPLVAQFVQHAPLLSERCAHRRARHHQQRHRVGVRLRHRGENIGKSGPRNREGGGGPAARAGVTVGGESRALFVAHQDMTQFGGREPTVQFEVVYAGNAEHGIDVVGCQEFDEITANGP
jgi:hypothetical protein